MGHGKDQQNAEVWITWLSALPAHCQLQPAKGTLTGTLTAMGTQLHTSHTLISLLNAGTWSSQVWNQPRKSILSLRIRKRRSSRWISSTEQSRGASPELLWILQLHNPHPQQENSTMPQMGPEWPLRGSCPHLGAWDYRLEREKLPRGLLGRALASNPRAWNWNRKLEGIISCTNMALTGGNVLSLMQQEHCYHP